MEIKKPKENSLPDLIVGGAFVVVGFIGITVLTGLLMPLSGALAAWLAWDYVITPMGTPNPGLLQVYLIMVFWGFFRTKIRTRGDRESKSVDWGGIGFLMAMPWATFAIIRLAVALFR